jgi:hypothetical protein
MRDLKPLDTNRLHRPLPTASQRSLKPEAELRRAASECPPSPSHNVPPCNASVPQPLAHERQRAGYPLPATRLYSGSRVLPAPRQCQSGAASDIQQYVLNAFFSPRPALNASSSALMRPTAPNMSSRPSASPPMLFPLPPSLLVPGPPFLVPGPPS